MLVDPYGVFVFQISALMTCLFQSLRSG